MSQMAPMTGEPMGVVPTSAIDYRAVTRPRWSGAEAGWMAEFPAVKQVRVAAPPDKILLAV